MKAVEYNTDNSAALIMGVKIGAIVTLDQPPRSTTAQPKNEDSENIAIWGTENDFPQQVINDVRKDADLPSLLDKQSVLLYSGGLTWGIPELDANNNEILKPLEKSKQLEVSTWMRRTNINRYLYEASEDLHWFFNAFPEIILQNDRKKIAQLCAQPAENCRWAKMNSKGIVETCFINANWPDVKDGDPLTKKLPVLDPYFDPAATLKALTKGTNYIYPLSFPTPGSTYYQLANWNGIRESGWLAVSQAIPKFKINLLEEQLNIKYHIEISDLFWPTRYPNWKDLNEAEKKKRVDAELKTFSDVMKGVENAGNSLVTSVKTDAQFGKEFSLWKITAIDNKVKKGEFMEEVKEAALAKMAAIGLHPALVGTMPNNGMGGAGSNIREAYNLHNIMNTPKQDILLEPLYVVRDYNGWPPEMEFRIKNPFMTTLNTGTETASTIKP